ncbi:hypothetical protein BC830DRAFT_455054 [Chytriomyces sp. MP71]|nr:hypothetical protein BC830DRAFT_455054 [Chytriomyces sp. MP71]
MRRSVFIWVFVAAVLLCVTTLLVATYGLNEGSSRRELLSMVNYRRFHAAALEAAFDSPLSLDAFDFAMHDYAHVFGGREPPPGYREWLKMAQRDQCSTSASTYAQIYKDLGPWFRIGRIDPSLLSLIPRMFGVKEESYKADGTDQFYFMLHEIFAEGKPPTQSHVFIIATHKTPSSTTLACAVPTETLSMHIACSRTPIISHRSTHFFPSLPRQSPNATTTLLCRQATTTLKSRNAATSMILFRGRKRKRSCFGVAPQAMGTTVPIRLTGRWDIE